jgi:hypothetical protein
MNMTDLDPALLSGTILCAVMAVISALRHKKRGVSAYIMAAAFLVLGLDMQLLRMRAPQAVIILGGVILIILLGCDFAARSAHTAQKENQK